jgi:hypothetical protein
VVSIAAGSELRDHREKVRLTPNVCITCP